ncbi:hypothetical protein L1887_43307 [Cichorium endivia]|nr:hypothetical protein L1887_43307 [Cichorium endivia]
MCFYNCVYARWVLCEVGVGAVEVDLADSGGIPDVLGDAVLVDVVALSVPVLVARLGLVGGEGNERERVVVVVEADELLARSVVSRVPAPLHLEAVDPRRGRRGVVGAGRTVVTGVLVAVIFSVGEVGAGSQSTVGHVGAGSKASGRIVALLKDELVRSAGLCFPLGVDGARVGVGCGGLVVEEDLADLLRGALDGRGQSNGARDVIEVEVSLGDGLRLVGAVANNEIGVGTSLAPEVVGRVAGVVDIAVRLAVEVELGEVGDVVLGPSEALGGIGVVGVELAVLEGEGGAGLVENAGGKTLRLVVSVDDVSDGVDGVALGVLVVSLADTGPKLLGLAADDELAIIAEAQRRTIDGDGAVMPRIDLAGSGALQRSCLDSRGGEQSREEDSPGESHFGLCVWESESEFMRVGERV